MAGFVLKNILPDNGGVTRSICKLDEQNNLTEVVETKNIIKTADGAEADVPLKDYDYNAEVELINPVADTVANANYRGADVDWYVKADDIVLKNKGTHAGNPQNNAPQQPPRK